MHTLLFCGHHLAAKIGIEPRTGVPFCFFAKISKTIVRRHVQAHCTAHSNPPLYRSNWAHCRIHLIVGHGNEMIRTSFKVFPHWKLSRSPILFGSLSILYIEVFVSSAAPPYVVPKATVKKAMSQARVTRSMVDEVACNCARMNRTIVFQVAMKNSRCLFYLHSGLFLFLGCERKV